MGMESLEYFVESAGVSNTVWIDAFECCHFETGTGGIARISWPDGKSYIEQSNILVQIFRTLKHQYVEAKRMSK